MTLLRTPLLESPDRTSLAALGHEWDELWRNSSATGPFMTWAWIGTWLDTVGRRTDLEVVTARDAASGELIGVAPFAVAQRRRRGIPFRALQVAGSGPTAPDHLDLLVRNDAAPGLADAMWHDVMSRQRWDFILLDGVAPDGHLARVAGGVGGAAAVATTPCPYLPLDGGWEAVSARFSGRLRNNLTRYGRKLDRTAAIEEHMVSDPDDLDRTFDHLVRFHQQIRTAKGDQGVFAPSEQRDFLRGAAHALLRADRLRMWRLDADGAPIAVIWCARARDEVAFYTTGYDPDWAAFGPGRRIMASAIRGAIDEGAAAFDFLRGDEPYKQEWGAVTRHNLSIRRATSTLGRALTAAHRAASTLRGRRRAG